MLTLPCGMLPVLILGFAGQNKQSSKNSAQLVVKVAILMREMHNMSVFFMVGLKYDDLLIKR